MNGEIFETIFEVQTKAFKIMKIQYLPIMIILITTLVYPQKPCAGMDSIQYSGQWYHTVQIGIQCWLKENLNIGQKINTDKGQSDNGIVEKFCYDNDALNCQRYGGLYQWNEALQYVRGGSNIQGICPNGWHLPTLDEFHLLFAFIGYDGNAFKQVGEGKNGGAGTNTSGFSALLSGYFYNTFMYEGILSIFWTTSEYSHSSGFDICPTGYNDVIYDGHSFKTDGFSVRCVKDHSSENEDHIVYNYFYK